jgi:hypothetical protein
MSGAIAPPQRAKSQTMPCSNPRAAWRAVRRAFCIAGRACAWDERELFRLDALRSFCDGVAALHRFHAAFSPS